MLSKYTKDISRRNFWLGFWRLADPKITMASMASILLGASLAAATQAIDATWLAVTVAAFFAVEVAKNASGDIYDYDTDRLVERKDKTSFSGGKRVLVDGLLSVKQCWLIAIVFYLIGISGGVVIVFFREPNALWIGLLGLTLAWLYNGPPARLAYRGLGELDVAICYGPLICLSTYLIQTGEMPFSVFLASLPLGLLIAAFLWVNEFPDYKADKKVNKRNLIVRLGRYRASRLLPFIQLLALVTLTLLPFAGLPVSVLFGCFAVIPSALAAYWLWQDPQKAYRYHPVSPMALVAFLSLSLGMSIGVMIQV